MIRTIAPTISAAETLRAIGAWGMSLTPMFNGKLGQASTEIRGSSRHNRNRSVRTVEAVADSPSQAVADLVEKLNPVAQTTEIVVGAGEIQWRKIDAGSPPAGRFETMAGKKNIQNNSRKDEGRFQKRHNNVF